jgi:AcrR family transcriptional regulator
MERRSDLVKRREGSILEGMAELTHGSHRAGRADALANRQRILEAAREVFARRGLDGEMREIAERAGVGVGTLYRHFESREGLLSALVHQAGEDMLRRVQAVVAAEDPRAALRATMHAAAEFCGQFGALTDVLLTRDLDKFHPGGHDEFHADHPDFIDEFRKLLANLLLRGIRDGVFRADLDVPVAVAALDSAFAPHMLLALATQRSYPAAADAIADFFLAAIEAPQR